MNKFNFLKLFVLSILFFSCNRQEDEGQKTSIQQTVIKGNQILKEVTNFQITDFTTNSNFAINNGVLNVNTVGTTQFNWSTLHENSELDFIYKENIESAALFGFKSQNAYGYQHSVFCSYSDGKIKIYNDKLDVVSTSDEKNDNYALGDNLKISIERLRLKYTFSVYNLTKGWKISYIVQCDPMGKPYVAHNESKIAVHLSSGNINLISYKLTSFSLSIENLFAGDSITYGQSGSTEGKRWASLVHGNNLISGGGADVTQNVKNRLPEIIALKPRRVFLMIGGNDILFNIPSSVWKNNLKEIRAQLAANGIEIVHLFTTPRPGASQMINFINNEPSFQTDMKIDTNTILSDGNPDVLKSEYNWGDGVHINDAGMILIANKINSVYN